MKARRLIVSVVLATAVSSAGCDTAGKGEAATPKPADWAGKVCAVMADAPALALPAVDPKDNDKSVRNVVAFLEKISAQLQRMRTRLERAGAPPVADGTYLLARTLNNLRRSQQEVDRAVLSLTRADVSDRGSYRAAIAATGKIMRQAQSYQGPVREMRADPRLRAAFDGAAACKAGKL